MGHFVLAAIGLPACKSYRRDSSAKGNNNLYLPAVMNELPKLNADSLRQVALKQVDPGGWIDGGQSPRLPDSVRVPGKYSLDNDAHGNVTNNMCNSTADVGGQQVCLPYYNGMSSLAQDELRRVEADYQLNV